MPLYDVQCTECENEFETFVKVRQIGDSYPHLITGVHCPSCSGICRSVITCTRNKDWFQPHWNPNFDLDPVFVKSRSHYRELCVKHDVTSKALGDVRNRKY